MIARVLSILAILGLAFAMVPLAVDVAPQSDLSPLSQTYVEQSAGTLGAQNVVTAIVVTFRGLDTLGEVTVLFIATAGVGFLLRMREDHREKEETDRGGRAGSTGEILATGSRFLLPLLFLFGVYIFLHGHLTPGGGFQGGVVLASGVLLLILGSTTTRIGHTMLSVIESLSGVFYVAAGLAGIFLASGFLDTTFLPSGTFGSLVSAGAIPVIYTFVGLKVGAELSGILENLRSR